MGRQEPSQKSSLPEESCPGSEGKQNWDDLENSSRDGEAEWKGSDCEVSALGKRHELRKEKNIVTYRIVFVFPFCFYDRNFFIKII